MINTVRIKPENRKTHYIKKYQKGKTIGVKLLEELNPSQYYYRFLGEIQSVDQDKTEGRVLVNLAKKVGDSTLNYADLVFSAESLKEITTSMNPGAFDFKRYAKTKGIYHQLELHNKNYLIRKTVNKGLKVGALSMREGMIRSLARHQFSGNEFSVITAILLGKRQGLSKELINDYKNAGAMHILAISGLHIGILLMILNYIFKPLEYFRHGKRIKMAFLLICLWSFAFISGLSASVLRAVCMFTALTFGLFSNRPSNISNYLFLSIFILIYVHPLFLLDLGFQLSYASVIAIIGLSPLIKRLWTPKKKAISYFWNLLVISVSAQVGILPLSLFYFHQFSGLFFASSLLIIPFLGIILGFGFLMIILDQINFLPLVFIKGYDFLIYSMNQTVHFLSGQNGLVYQNVYFSLALLILTYGLIVSLTKFMENGSTKKLALLLVSIISIQGALIFEKRKTQKSAEFIVFHQTKGSVIAERKGEKIMVISDLKPDDPKLTRLIEPYLHQLYPLQLVYGSEFSNLFLAGKKRILMIDGEAPADDFGFHPDFIVLKNAPKINLERLLNRIRPEVVISDGSNFRSQTKRWQTTCKKLGIRFHDTFQNGAFVYANKS
jgi:competence protein ComEC